MARILALDFGSKRTGIAVTDELQFIASGLTTVETPKLLGFLKSYIASEKVGLIVIGEPKRFNNEHPEIEASIKAFIERLNEALPNVPVERVDERFTSKLAFQSMLDSGLKKKQRQDKALLDEISATIILQTYLSKK